MLPRLYCTHRWWHSESHKVVLPSDVVGLVEFSKVSIFASSHRTRLPHWVHTHNHRLKTLVLMNYHCTVCKSCQTRWLFSVFVMDSHWLRRLHPPWTHWPSLGVLFLPRVKIPTIIQKILRNKYHNWPRHVVSDEVRWSYAVLRSTLQSVLPSTSVPLSDASCNWFQSHLNQVCWCSLDSWLGCSPSWS